MPQDLQQVTKTLSDREKISAIIWIIIGAMQCFTFIAVVAGAWNIYVGVSRLKQSNAVLKPWKGIVASYENSQTNIIIGLIINLLLGGVIGVAGSIFDLIGIRGYVLENRQVFEKYGL